MCGNGGEMPKPKHINSEPSADGSSGLKTSGPGRNRNVPPPEYRWKPGQSGNPKGREPRPSLLKHLQGTVNEPIPPMLYGRAKLFLGSSADDRASTAVKEITNGEFLARAWLTSAQVGKIPVPRKRFSILYLRSPCSPYLLLVMVASPHPG